MPEEKNVLLSMFGGALGGAIATRLMKIQKVSSGKEIIEQLSISSPVVLKQASYKFAIILFHGNGDPGVTITVTTGTAQSSIAGSEQAIEIVANETVKIEASGTGKTPTVEIGYINW